MEIRRNKHGDLEMVFDEEDEYSGEELLAGRADINQEQDRMGRYTSTYGLGGMETDLDKKIRADEKRLGWSEPHKAKGIAKRCPVCGVIYRGRANQKYCSVRCRKTAEMRRYRAKKRELRDFKPHRGKAGEVYFMSYPEPNREEISFIPAIFALDRAAAEKYLRENFEGDPHLDDYIEQMKEVIKK